MADKTTSIERAAAMLGQLPDESAIERAARVMEQARAESGPGGVLPLDMETLIEPDLHTGISGRPTQPFTAPTRPFVPGQPTESRQATTDLQSMSRRGPPSPLGEKTRIAKQSRPTGQAA